MSNGAQDFVIICLKAHSITGVLEQMQPLLGPHTRVVTAVNGIPYWYFHKHGGDHQGSTLESIDPGGRQWRELGPERAIGCIVYPATEDRDCRVGTPWPKREAYEGPCKRGWISARFLKMLAG